MKIRTLLAIGCTSLLMSTSNANEPENNTIQQRAKLMEERVSELLADRVNKDAILKDMVSINDMALEEMMERERLNFPAEELYGSNWHNKAVNPFHNLKVTFPDSAQIDCSRFTMPIDGTVKVTSKYGMRHRRMHRGIDLKVQIGDTIRAAFDGKVRMSSFERKGYGYYLVLRHPNGLETIYGHLSKFLVKEDEIVRAGDPIALGGNTGRSTGSHLHFETRFLGQDLNPAELIDFENGVPHRDMYAFYNVKVNGRNSNIYTSNNSKMAYHRVKSGDNLGKIARMYGTSVSELCRLNGLKTTSVLRIGQSIRVNTSGGTTQATASTSAAATPKAATVAASIPNPGTEVPATVSTEADGPVYHKIQKGDTLGKIARTYGTTVGKLCELNNIRQNTVLRLGQTLRCS